VTPRFLPARSRLRKRLLRTGIVLAGLIVLVLAYGFAETYMLEVKQYNIADADLPPEFDGVRVVFLTDIHHGVFFSQERVARLVDKVNALRPDLVLLGGDYVFGELDYENSCFAELARLEAPLGRYAVLGNNE
jgi:predicted MPP superfamily phosphohydrolase